MLCQVTTQMHVMIIPTVMLQAQPLFTQLLARAL
jgi:hypothetical protein